MVASLPPRRYSVLDEDFDPMLARRLSISVNGIEQHKVISYDRDAGTVLRYEVDMDGRIVVLDARSGEAATELVKGNVTVDWIVDTPGGGSKV